MSPLLLAVTLAVAALIAIGLYRVWAGPTVFDRLVAVALVTVNGVVLIVLLGFLLGRMSFFLDIALAYALLAFLLPIAVGRYFEDRSPSGPVIEPRTAPGAGPGSDGEERP